jgi:dipeptidyl aminopeptidase/acylaminoacyl peptidase
MGGYMEKTRKPFGLWPTPLSAAAISEAVSIPEAEWSPDGKWLVWLEEHSGKGILFARGPGDLAARRITGEESVRATIGYGGGNFTVGREHAFFVERSGRLHRQPLEAGASRPITPPGTLCAAPALSPDGRWLAYVFELEGSAGLAIVDGEGQHWPRKLTGGLDFYMHPAWSPDGRALAWVGWNHPHMPWDSSRLFLGRLEAAAEEPQLAGEPEALAGGEREAVLQPQFSPDGARLAYLSDRQGWFQLYVRELATGQERRLTPDRDEIGGAAWQQGMRWFGWLPDGRALIAARNHEGSITLVRVDAAGGGLEPLPQGPYTTLTRPVVNPADRRIAVLAAADHLPSRLAVLDAAPPGEAPRVIRRTMAERIPPGDLARARPISWRDGAGELIYGLFAPPASSRYEDRGLPPLVVNIHGGPTGQTYLTWRPELQFFTSRGYAVLDVNHRGSTGYGRAYRERLRGQWGVYDVEDAISGSRHVAAEGWADAGRCAIRGSSAGGYTVLRALALHPGLFRAGICFYGISDLLLLARETHKFEAHYLDTLIGPLPQAAARYRERSPLHLAHQITTPLIVFQGAEDRVVPPAQSERIVASLRERGIAHEYHLFPGEGHGFRESGHVRAAFEAMERFLLTHVVFS